MSEFHGQKLEAGGVATAWPDAPSSFRSDLIDDATIYPRIRLAGNYGVNFCGNYQEKTVHNKTADDARRIAWAMFGTCGHKIYFYDSNGNLVREE